ncbi:MAG: EpsI family protein [Planctomycetota bacterium]
MSFARRVWVLGLVLLPVAGLSLWLSFSEARATRHANIARDVPLKIGGWQGEDKKLSDRVYELLETRDVVFRRYRRKDENIWLCLVQAQDNRRGSHPPEICYIGQGFEVDENRTAELRLDPGKALSVRRLKIHKSDQEWAVLYWYQVGTWQTSSYFAQQLQLIINLLLARKAPAVVVRFDTRIEEAESEEDAYARLERFARASLPVLSRALVSEPD